MQLGRDHGPAAVLEEGLLDGEARASVEREGGWVVAVHLDVGALGARCGESSQRLLD
jgi:hypothetical protein